MNFAGLHQSSTFIQGAFKFYFYPFFVAIPYRKHNFWGVFFFFFLRAWKCPFQFDFNPSPTEPGYVLPLQTV